MIINNIRLYLVLGGSFFLAMWISHPVPQHQSPKGRFLLDKEENNSTLPWCSFEGHDAPHSLENATWIDPEDPPGHYYSNLLFRPHLSDNLLHELQSRIEQDPPDADRRRRAARLHLLPGDQCRMHQWDVDGFQKCMHGRRLIFIGDSLATQQAKSLIAMINMFGIATVKDTHTPKISRCRHCWNFTALDGSFEIYGRAVYAYEDIGEHHPLIYSREGWDWIINGLGGWKDGDILVVNFASHYDADWLYLQQQLRELFEDVLAQIPKHKVTIFWRDYAPAHYEANIDGEFPSGKRIVKFKGDPGCVPHMTAPNTPSMEKYIVSKVLRNCGDKCANIRRLGVWDLLRNAWDQHEEGSTCIAEDACDCRHFALPGPMEFVNILLYHQLCFKH